MLVRRGRIRTEAGTDDKVADIDQLQYEAGDGPCLTSLHEELTVRADDLREEERWPRFARAAADAGVRSMLSLQLFVQDNNIGALNLYAAEPNAFAPEDEKVGLMLASHAAVALVDARKIDNLQIALESRDIIGQAKGILMERYKVDANRAFGMLVAVSQRRQRKLNEVAEYLASTGALPDETTE
jgi:GAF domain-containing protein